MSRPNPRRKKQRVVRPQHPAKEPVPKYDYTIVTPDGSFSFRAPSDEAATAYCEKRHLFGDLVGGPGGSLTPESAGEVRPPKRKAAKKKKTAR